MNYQISTSNKSLATMSSQDLLMVINSARTEHGESTVANRHFNARIESELEGELPPRKTFTHPSNGSAVTYYDLSQDQCLLVGMRESKAVRRNVLARLGTEKSPKEPAWVAGLSPQALIAIEDLSSQVSHYKTETSRLNTVCNDLALNLREGITPAAFSRMLNGVNINRVQPLLVERKRLLKTPNGYRAAAAYRDKLFTERRHVNDDGRLCERVVLTLRGAKWLYAEYEKGQLEMKKDWDGEHSHLMLGEGEAA